MSLDELIEVTATHEEGHLLDRTRFLPLSKHWGAALLFLLESGFSPTRVAESLPYTDARPRTGATLSEPSFVAAKKKSLEIFQREVRR